VKFPVNFKTNGPYRAEALSGGNLSIIFKPHWLAAPGFADLGAVYPNSGDGAPGVVVFRCEVRRTGSLSNCEATREEPRGKGFEAAARKLVPKFQLDMDPKALSGPLKVNLPIRLIDPASEEFRLRRLGEPRWITTIDPARVQALFPAEAAAKGLKTGRGSVSCGVGPDGALTDCQPGAAEPEGLGFSEAAMRVATVMRMNPWTDAGGPVDGARMVLPIRFNLADTPAAATPKP
jgi:hypothetical protein